MNSLGLGLSLRPGGASAAALLGLGGKTGSSLGGKGEDEMASVLGGNFLSTMQGLAKGAGMNAPGGGKKLKGKGGGLGMGAGGGRRGRKGFDAYDEGSLMADDDDLVVVDRSAVAFIGRRTDRANEDEPSIRYDKDVLLGFREQCTQLPPDLEGTTFEIVLQPGDEHSREQQMAELTARLTAQKEEGGEVADPAVSTKEDTRDWRARQPAPSFEEKQAPKEEGEWKEGKVAKEPAKGGKGEDNWRKPGGSSPAPPAAKPAAAGRPRDAPTRGGPGAPASRPAPQIPRGAPIVDHRRMQKASEKGLTAWAPNVGQSDDERALRQVRGLLNKLTPENFEKLFGQLLEKITTADVLSGSISMLFEKAVAEPIFCAMNAELCLKLGRELPEFPPPPGDTKPMTFRRILLNTCQEEFEGSLVGLSKEDVEQQEDAESKAKRAMVGNVRFIGNLFKQRVIGQMIVHVCVQQLLSDRGSGAAQKAIHENCVECACELLSLTGGILQESAQTKPLVESYFARLMQLHQSGLSARIKFKIRDIQELRKARWVPRKEAAQAKTISEIHAEAQAELGIVALPTKLSKTFAPLSGMKTRADEVQDLLPALRGGDAGWEFVGKKGPRSESNIIDGNKFSAFIGEAPPVPEAKKAKAEAKEAKQERAGKEKPRESTSTPKTPEELEKRTKSLLAEYIVSADIAEALLCVKELNSVDFLPKVVELVIAQLLDNAKPKEKDLLINLLVSLKKRNAVSAEHLSKGLHAHTDMLEDLALDIPLAPQLIGEAVAACVAQGQAEASIIPELIEKVEDTEARRKLVGAILVELKKQKGVTTVKEMLEGAKINLEELLKEDPEFDLPETPTAKKFLETKGLSGLLA